MSNSIAQNADPMLFAWMDAFENPVSADEATDLEVEPWMEAPTQMAPAPTPRESTRLDAASLFADLELAGAPPSAPLSSSMLPPASDVPTLPMFDGPISTHTPMSAPVLTVRREAPTYRTRRPPPMPMPMPMPIDKTRSWTIAVLVCGTCALVAALAACAIYIQMPQAPAAPSPAAQAAR